MSSTATRDTLPAFIAHRGLSARAPENTLAAVRAAHAAGCRWVELDVQLLGDGTPVIWHDAGTRRCSGERRRLSTLDLAGAQRLDVGRWFSEAFAGERMATLEAMLELIVDLDLGLNLEFKVNRGRDARALVERVLPRVERRLDPQRWLASSFERTALQALRRLRPDPERLRLGLLYEKAPRQWAAQAASLSAFSVHVDYRRLREPLARTIAASPYRLVCYTVNDPLAARRLRDWGAAALISDDPPRLDRGQLTRATPSAALNP
ncbi:MULTISPECIES: glycerophosphodiester phosphodiesterase family protein [unclassified Modicisalibacter]|uniref:glycerophosphodiester phosphodiesterase family protein n=1 Tax=unclassified Modicisalibacter TaxID=2679913 RepID=UPI001CCCADB0|nr:MULTISPECIES: glycerophosphodiester phosphodiesterase family protein [unclassified Modicisalibacter]MBZ9556535.1 glycerophosphoryl diester phosphodiesterase [Modicisalibacter sp. R2A 31.J]MBZ9574996.1 glycerophosphoryl diester phosphodiesterase [Modicisalibacter sp. MOD 31.J]